MDLRRRNSTGLLPWIAGVLAVHLLLLGQLGAGPPVARWPGNPSAPFLHVRTLPPSPDSPAAVASARHRPGTGAADASAPAREAFAPLVLPRQVEADYEVRSTRAGQAGQGQARLTFAQDGTRYEARLEVGGDAAVARVQRSTGTVSAEGLAPERFTERRRSEQAAHFGHGRRRLVFSGQAPTADLPPGAQDRLSVLLQLPALLASRGPSAWRRGAVLTVHVASVREIEAWRLRADDEPATAGEDPVGGGHLYLVRESTREFDLRVELWLAPGVADVPLRLRLTTADGDWIDYRRPGPTNAEPAPR